MHMCSNGFIYMGPVGGLVGHCLNQVLICKEMKQLAISICKETHTYTRVELVDALMD